MCVKNKLGILLKAQKVLVCLDDLKKFFYFSLTRWFIIVGWWWCINHRLNCHMWWYITPDELVTRLYYCIISFWILARESWDINTLLRAFRLNHQQINHMHETKKEVVAFYSTRGWKYRIFFLFRPIFFCQIIISRSKCDKAKKNY